MRRARSVALALAGLAAAAAPAAAQGSAFALRGLGWAGRPVSARAAGFGGGLSALDPEMSVNPAVLARWRSVAGWAVAAPTRREFDGTAGPVENETVRFPLIGFATSVRGRLSVGFSFSDYLDRTYAIVVRDTLVINGTPEPYKDAARSLGGVSDVQLGVGYRLRPSLLVGAGFHYYLGSVRLTAQRVFDNVAYLDVLEAGITDYRGLGVAAGLVFQPTASLDIGLSGRVNGSLRAEDLREGTVVQVPLAHEAALGVRLQVVPGVSLAGTAQWAGWSRANEALPQSSGGARDTWALSGGLEIQRVTLIRLRTPLRAGYRVRQLPFLSLGEGVDEQAWSFGFGFTFAQDRANLDFAFEQGSRAAGPTEERFTTGFVGLTIRP
jgi:hypothetical protein